MCVHPIPSIPFHPAPPTPPVIWSWRTRSDTIAKNIYLSSGSRLSKEALFIIPLLCCCRYSRLRGWVVYNMYPDCCAREKEVSTWFVCTMYNFSRPLPPHPQPSGPQPSCPGPPRPPLFSTPLAPTPLSTDHFLMSATDRSGEDLRPGAADPCVERGKLPRRNTQAAAPGEGAQVQAAGAVPQYLGQFQV